jgi:hypothetical protein
MAVTMKNVVYWDLTVCDSCKNRRFRGTIASIIRVTRIGELRTTLAVTSNRRALRRNTEANRLLVTAIVVSSSLILVTLMMEFLRNVGSYKSHTA